MDFKKKLFFILSQPGAIYRWWRVWGTKPVLSWVIAAQYFHNGEFRRARDLYLLGLEKNSAHCAARCARLDLAYCYYRLEDFRESLKELAKVVRAKEPLRDGYFLQARILTALGKLKHATRVLSNATKALPEDSALLALYAHTLYFDRSPKENADRVNREIVFKQKVTDINHPDYRALDAARAHYELIYGDRAVGEKILVRALASGEAPFEAYLIRGEQLLENNRVAVAREQFSRAISFVPLDPRPLKFLAQSYLVEGEENYEWAESLAVRAANISCWQDPAAIEILIKCARAKNDEVHEVLYTNRYYELKISSDLDLAEIKRAATQVQLLQQLK